MKKTTKLFALMLVLAMIVSMAACGSKTETPAETTTTTPAETTTTAPAADPATPRHYAVDENTVVVCTADETPSVTARGHSAVAANYINRLTYESLMKLDESNNPQPWLAESFEYEEQADGTYLWTFHLRKGVKFHNGEEMKAKDVVASLQEAKISPEVEVSTRDFDDVKEVDDYTVTMVSPGPTATLLNDLSGHGNAVVPAALIESGHDFNEEPIGTGPYIMTNWTISESLTFKAFDEYWAGKANIENVIWKIIPEGSARTIALQAHEVDYIIELDSNDLGLVEADENLTLENVFSFGHNWLNLNNEHKPFDNVNVRKAMNAAINKEDVVTVALNGAGIVAGGQAPVGLFGFDATGYDGYDVELAKKYADASGVDLSTVTFEIICSDDTKRRAAQVIQDNLNDVFGMTAELVSMDLATYLSQTAQGNHDAFIGGYTGSDMTGWLRGLYTSEQIGGSNKTRTNDPKLDEMIYTACKTIDADAREVMLNEICQYLNDLCPQIPIYQPSTISAHNKYLTGVSITGSKAFDVEKWSWE